MECSPHLQTGSVTPGDGSRTSGKIFGIGGEGWIGKSFCLRSLAALSAWLLVASLSALSSFGLTSLDPAIAVEVMCNHTETNPKLPDRKYMVNDDNPSNGSDLSTCQVNTRTLKDLGWMGWLHWHEPDKNHPARWQHLHRPRVAKEGEPRTPTGRVNIWRKLDSPNGSRELMLEAVQRALATIRRRKWRESAYNLGSLLCAASLVPGPGNPCHARALRFAAKFEELTR